MSTETPWTFRYAKATKPYMGMSGKPAGWQVVDRETGKRLGTDYRYPTREEAEDAAPGMHAAQQQRVADRELRDTVREFEYQAATREDKYRTVTNHLGTGRVYDSHPGATEYDGGDVLGTVQIWDNS